MPYGHASMLLLGEASEATNQYSKFEAFFGLVQTKVIFGLVQPKVIIGLVISRRYCLFRLLQKIANACEARLCLCVIFTLPKDPKDYQKDLCIIA